MRETLCSAVTLFFFALSVHSIWVMYTAVRSGWQVTVTAGLRWAIIDYVSGLVFIFVYITNRKSHRFLLLPSILVALTALVVGAWWPLLYMASILAGAESLYALVPLGNEEGGGEVGSGRDCYVIAMIFSLLAIADVLMAIMAISDVRDNKLQQVVGVQGVTILCFVVVFVIVRESSFMNAAPWVVLLAVSGNAGTCMYAVAIAIRAVQEDVTFRTALLSPANAFHLVTQVPDYEAV